LPRRYNVPQNKSDNIKRKIIAVILLSIILFSRINGQDPLSVKMLDSLGYSYCPSEYIKSANRGDLKAVQLFINSGMPIDTVVYLDNEGLTSAIYQACFYNQVEVLRYLLKKRANVNLQNKYHNLPSPIFYAIKNAKDTCTVKLLLENGADISSNSKYFGATPLLYAHFLKKDSIRELIKRYGADFHDQYLPESDFIWGIIAEIAKEVQQYFRKPKAFGGGNWKSFKGFKIQIPIKKLEVGKFIIKINKYDIELKWQEITFKDQYKTYIKVSMSLCSDL
jgi:hypothetical protein